MPVQMHRVFIFHTNLSLIRMGNEQEKCLSTFRANYSELCKEHNGTVYKHNSTPELYYLKEYVFGNEEQYHLQLS